MTEDEAKTKWCPYGANKFAVETIEEMKARHSATSATRDDNHPYVPGQFALLGTTVAANAVRCIGSQCMAWRWTYEPGEVVAMAGDVRVSGPYSVAVRSGSVGYCGLAGKP